MSHRNEFAKDSRWLLTECYIWDPANYPSKLSSTYYPYMVYAFAADEGEVHSYKVIVLLGPKYSYQARAMIYL